MRDAATSAPVARAAVFVRAADGAYTGFYAATDDSGRYCLSLPAGVYDLEIRRDDYVLSYVRGVVVTGDVTSVESLTGLRGVEFAAPWPNPAKSSASFRVRVPRAGTYRISVFDLNGRIVRGWEGHASGSEERLVSWDLRDASGRRVPAGRYVASLDFEDARLTRRLSVLR